MSNQEAIVICVVAVALLAFMAWACFVGSRTTYTPQPSRRDVQPAMWTTSRPAPSAEIWISRNRMGGTPCIFGTRIPTDVIAAFKDDPTEAGRRYPGITPEHVEAAVWWEARHE